MSEIDKKAMQARMNELRRLPNPSDSEQEELASLEAELSTPPTDPVAPVDAGDGFDPSIAPLDPDADGDIGEDDLGDLEDPSDVDLSDEGLVDPLSAPDEGTPIQAQESPDPKRVSQDEMVMMTKGQLDYLNRMARKIELMEKNNSVRDPNAARVESFGEWEEVKEEKRPTMIWLKLYTPLGTRKRYPIIHRTPTVYRAEKNKRGDQVIVPWARFTYLTEDGSKETVDMRLRSYTKIKPVVWCTVLDRKQKPLRMPVGKTQGRMVHDPENWTSRAAGSEKTQYVTKIKETFSVVIPSKGNSAGKVDLNENMQIDIEGRCVNGS